MMEGQTIAAVGVDHAEADGDSEEGAPAELGIKELDCSGFFSLYEEI